MEERGKIANQIYQFLEERINCGNIISYIDKYKNKEENIDSITSLTIESIPVAFKVIRYDDKSTNDKDINSDTNTDSNKDTDTNSKITSKKTVEKIYDMYDFISESNHTGFEYFPYLYGVLDCHNKFDSKVYVLYESFDGTISELLKQISHPTEWYEIFFQIILIHHFVSNISNKKYSNGTLNNHLYKKYKHPIKKQYSLGEYKFEIFHRNLIVMWNFELDDTNTSNDQNLKINIDYLLDFFKEHTDTMENKPTGRLMSLLHEIKSSPTEIPKILDKYYNTSKNTKPSQQTNEHIGYIKSKHSLKH
jgi:hypothetical protein